MVHWIWLVIAGQAGFIVGYITFGLMRAAAEPSSCYECSSGCDCEGPRL